MGCKASPRPGSTNPRLSSQTLARWDGLLILERLKSNRLLSHIPVIVVTVRDRQEAEEQIRRLGAAAYLQNPIQADALMASIQTVLAPQDGAPENGPANVA
jgi:CheY-like chemotaxis protein